jgi:L-asparaginase
MVPRNPPFLCIAGSNMTANKARLLLMAAMMKLGALPPAADPRTPTHQLAAIKTKLDQYQAIFDTH